ncbi:ribosomal protein S18-alanine N-acetyltransferase [Nocardia stercoris]|uniref:Ribosomal-protein-alanine N-acetyltransferase n=1 Tax=Nocardia stercoris TaxID=2483361 RepID=A0A3M2L2L6_9NOCA|nr:ribosomal protein S18-alanine N-acetyltransferase [Nocardia stercoris]RMI31959.1 ribosomal-protein-alanine N-acetyltransferase [Nocardia stercoris]
MSPKDIARCVELEQVLFPDDDPWTEVSFRSELAGPHNRYLVARTETGRTVGYCGVALLGTDAHPEAEIHTIGVDPACHRAGIGTLLLLAMLAAAGERGGPVFLEVRTDNAAAIAMYERHGFHIIGLRKNYYQPSGADAYTMRRPALTGSIVSEVLA